MAIPTISSTNPRLCFALADYVGSGVTLNAGSSAVPVTLARPAGDDLFTSGIRLWQMATAYGLDRAGTATSQFITLTVPSSGTRTVVIALRVAYCGAGNISPAATVGYGSWNPATGNNFASQIRSCNVKIGATTSPYIIPNGGTDGGPVVVQAPGSTSNDPIFHWCYAVATVSNTGIPQTFSLADGDNTVTIWNTNGGLVIEGVYIVDTSITNWQNAPRTYDGFSTTTLALTIARAKLVNAATRALRVLFIGDSLSANATAQATYFARKLCQRYGDAGRVQLAQDFGTSWGTTTGTNAATLTVAFAGGANYTSADVYALKGYQWTVAQSGGAKFTFTGTAFQIIYEYQAGGGNIEYVIDADDPNAVDVSADGAAGTFGSIAVSGLTNTTHTVEIFADAGPVRFISFWGGVRSGVMAMRLATAGKNFVDIFPSGKTANLASLLAAFLPDIIFVECVNNSTNGAAALVTDSNALSVYLTPFNTYLTTMAAVTGTPAIVLVQPHIFGTTTQTRSGGTFPADQTDMDVPEFNRTLIDLSTRGYLNAALGFVDYAADVGYPSQFDTLYDQSFYATQSAGSVSDFHFSATGAVTEGERLANLFLGPDIRGGAGRALSNIGIGTGFGF